MTNLEQGTDACLWTPADVLTDKAGAWAWEKARLTAQGAQRGPVCRALGKAHEDQCARARRGWAARTCGETKWRLYWASGLGTVFVWARVINYGYVRVFPKREPRESISVLGDGINLLSVCKADGAVLPLRFCCARPPSVCGDRSEQGDPPLPQGSGQAGAGAG